MINRTNLFKHFRVGLLAVILLLFLPVSIGNCKNFSVVQAAVSVKQTNSDLIVMPDKYNTNPVEPDGGFTVVKKGQTIHAKNTAGKNMDIILQDSDLTQKVNLAYANKHLKGTIVLKNLDFSKNMNVFTFLGEGRDANNEVRFEFENCKFNAFNVGREEQKNLSYKFVRCSFKSFFGSNAYFRRCYFGGGIGDRIVPFNNVLVRRCYIANPSSSTANAGEIHVDGTQIYGWQTTKAHNIKFEQSRFEMPNIKYQNAPKTYVNACIMLQLEFNDGCNMNFTDCYINGGGYSIYAHVKGDKWKLKNINFKNLTFGCAAKWGKLYPHVDKAVKTNQNTWKDADSIYVGRVARICKKQETRLSVSNDTNQARQFVVCTSTGNKYTFKIDACPKASEFGNKKFEDFPFDRIYSIPERCDYLVVYDVTNGANKQVRYKNWTTPVEINSRKATGSYVNIKWGIVKNVSGYQIQTSSTSDFKSSDTNTASVKGLSNTSAKVKNRKASSKYFVRVRTYTNAKVNGKSATVYGTWSEIKKASK